ncbi:MAG: response regulator [Bacteroidota bacterium]
MAYKNIVLIDDDTEDQEIFLSVVNDISSSAHCDCYTDASEALKNLKALAGVPDVIFLDLNMPVMNGKQFLSAIKEEEGLKEIPVIMFTTSSDPATIKATKDLGAEDFITKPGSYNELVTILKNLID